ncbi:hypothetical protein GCM10007049_15700 [Echinicola pacifica]|uniref:Alginate lyase n=1 Tax=Echinicola pacifica TaxID=346377 RepID=A0A918PVS7_9BACT|nr:heparinase II/III family protein [Echinicola pacifica]GGZ23580.1 hypothetical protein GCM10007049_15700 [Echinicola pacifica]
MSKTLSNILLITCFGLLLGACDSSPKKQTLGHTSILFDEATIAQVDEAMSWPLFEQSVAEAKSFVEEQMALGIQVPVPKDLAGGYTHERHKLNYLSMQQAGKLFIITGEEKYAQYVKDLLMAYAELYPSLDRHPSRKSYSPGKFFWQCLNDANWLVYTSQAYDCIYDWMSEEERNIVESKLLRPQADFLSIETPQFFNRIHNHSTWANAGVGMLGLVIGDTLLVHRSLYGLEDDGLDTETTDNDGARIKNQERAGFLAQLDLLFSPDGFYAEGPYYQRYAIYPFVVFAASLQNAKPDQKIFEYRDGILGKAVYALVNLTDEEGEFFPINDAQKGMSYYSRELISAVNIAYHFAGQNPELLSIAQKQNTVLLDAAGMHVAKDIEAGMSQPFAHKSMELTDGTDGNSGGLGILRMKGETGSLSAVLKYTAQGMGHGHFDKLSLSVYQEGAEVLQDYGVARFVNIEQKDGGGYLSENQTFAKQTIAHNALVVNRQSHYTGSTELGSQYHSDRFFFDAGNEDIKIVSAKDAHAYEGIGQQRTIALIQDELFEKPILIDVLSVASESKNHYDLPYYYFGQLLSTTWENKIAETLRPLGESDGYQHLWMEAQGTASAGNSKITWMDRNQFYTLSTLSLEGDQMTLARTGANDPKFNLRRDPMVMISREDASTSFVSILEPHGSYSTVSELSQGASSQVQGLKILFESEEYIAIEWQHISGQTYRLAIAKSNNGQEESHQIKIENKLWDWKGSYSYIKI